MLIVAEVEVSAVVGEAHIAPWDRLGVVSDRLASLGGRDREPRALQETADALFLDKLHGLCLELFTDVTIGRFSASDGV